MTPARWPAFVLALALGITSACTAADTPAADPDGTAGHLGSGALAVEALSTRPEYVTGGDVLVGVVATQPELLDRVVVRADRRDVTDAFTRDGDRLVGLVEGLPEGEVTLVAEAGDDVAELVVTNHPTTGPLFSGPHLAPFVCTTEEAGLGPATDRNCTAATVERTEEVAPGVTARVERGVLGRSIYTLAVPEAWNRRLVYRFGGGCGTSYSQGAALVDAVDPDLLSAGYAVVTSSLNTFQVACNDVLSAEVALMTKEHVIETIGMPDFTIGEGGSGGAIQQLLLAQDYPGLLDGIIPAVPFPDALSISGGVTDCGLLQRYYATPAGAALSEEQRAAVNGHRTTGTCALWDRAFVPVVDASRGCTPALADQVFEPETRPDGVRCTLQDSAAAVIGRDPETGHGLRPLDNVGVQYGREALRAGTLSPAEFLDLNEGIGGWDPDGRPVPARTEAPVEALASAYRGGRILVDAEGLAAVPIVLVNVYTDDKGDIHDRQRVFAIRERLATGTATDANLVIWTRPGAQDLTSTLLGAVGDTAVAVAVVDTWLTAAAADSSEGPWAEKLARNRPVDAVDTCVLPGGEIRRGDDVYVDDEDCATAYPVASDPRRVAGAPLRNDILKCALVPLDPSAYPGFSPDELARLARIFPDGVCDWTDPGVGTVPFAGPWQSYGR